VQSKEMQDSERRVEVRDLPVRLFHWSLVVLIAFSWWAADQGGNWMWYHLWSGYAILTLIVFRIAWGFLGSTHARFGDFLHGPRATLDFIKSLPRRETVDYAGYNPPGGIMILLLLLCVLVQALTGLFANDDIVTEGPLFHWVSKETSDLLTTLHKYGFDVLLVLIAVHICAQIFYLVYKSTDLVTPMLTGTRKRGGSIGREEGRAANLGLAAAVLLAAALAVYLLVR
jgi:cytochrome b